MAVPPVPPLPARPRTADPFRRVRFDARDYVWLQLGSIKSVGRVAGQVLLETDTQLYQLDPQSNPEMRSPEQILADAMGESALADCIPTLKAQILDMIERRKVEERAIEYLIGQRADLLAELKALRADRAKFGLSIAELEPTAGILSLFRKKEGV